MTSSKDTLKAIQEKLKGTTNPVESVATKKSEINNKVAETPKVEKLKKKPDLGGKTPGHKPLSSNGGARDGAGRPPGGLSLEKRTQKALLSNFFAEEIDVRMRDPKTGKEVVVKKPRTLIVAERLFKFTDKTPQAVDLYLNRVIGKAPQPVVGDEDEAPVQVNITAQRTLEKLYDEEPE